VQRDGGNLLLYRGDAVVPVRQEIHELGGLSRQYLNHRHEASASSDSIAEEFSAPLFVHRAEADAVSKTATLGALFLERHRLDGDFEVIPTPGHTAGATTYLWDSGEHRVLFTGDTIYLREGDWVAAVLASSDRDSYLHSLELIRGLEFDVLVPWAATAGAPYYARVDKAETERRIDAILVRLDRGENR
jgi:glyoxylase-like metal-dependent hydrolase (beta-lactamase superfamily II)